MKVARATEPMSRQVARQEDAAGASLVALRLHRAGSHCREIDGHDGGGMFRQRIWVAVLGGGNPDKMG